MEHLTFVVVAVFFLILNAIFNGAETGLVALDIEYLRCRARKTDRGSREHRLLALARYPERYLAVTLIAINSTFVIGTSMLTTVIENTNPSLIEFFSVILSVLMFIFCQFLPKMAFNHRPLRTCLKFLPLLSLSDRMFKLPVRIITMLTRAIMRLLRINSENFTLSRDELLILLSHGVNSGAIHKDSNSMAAGIIGLRDTIAREVMIPRTQVLAFDVTTPIEEVKLKMLASGYSRVPVYQGEIDRVVGILYFKDLFLREVEAKTLKEILSRPMFVPESKSAFELFKEMRTRSVQVAIVLDEYASMSGIVTFEDLVEEVVGEIHDEFDKPRNDLKFNDDGSIVFSGDIHITEFNKKTSYNFASAENVTTMNGLVQVELGRIPAKGETFSIDGVSFKIMASNQRKVEWLKIIS